jgi:hypothetical protein
VYPLHIIQYHQQKKHVVLLSDHDHPHGNDTDSIKDTPGQLETNKQPNESGGFLSSPENSVESLLETNVEAFLRDTIKLLADVAWQDQLQFEQARPFIVSPPYPCSLFICCCVAALGYLLWVPSRSVSQPTATSLYSKFRR